MDFGVHIKRAACVGLLTALAACEAVLTPPVAPPPDTPENPEPAPQPAPQVTPPSEASRELSVYYQRLQNDLLVQGLLRVDGGGPDTMFTASQLARNFVRIALFNEYQDDTDLSSPIATVSKLRRWEQPIRMQVEFGRSVTPEQQNLDRTSVSAYAARLSRLTGVPISQSDRNPNFHVLFYSEDDRVASADRLRSLIPGMSQRTLQALINLPRDQLCVVIGTFAPDGARYQKAVAIIRAEHPSLMRTACIHEELAQAMGLANDSPQARPSIFNDDEEFGLLTTHDELLLRMLYDDRFETGMAPNVAAPIARDITAEYLAGGAS